MSQNISDEHLKLIDTTLEAYSEYKNFKSKISLAMELVDLFKE